jgi:hypothetical protein
VLIIYYLRRQEVRVYFGRKISAPSQMWLQQLNLQLSSVRDYHYLSRVSEQITS